MKKVQIVILITAAVVSFIGSFGITYLIKQSKPAIPEIAENQAADPIEAQTPADKNMELANILDQGDEWSQSMSEKQLESLIYDIREKMREYEDRQRDLDIEEERLAIAKDSLNHDIERLEKMRSQLTTLLADLKQQKANLDETVLEIDELEKINIQRLAIRYDKMDVTYAAKIMSNMVKNQQIDDAVKIMFYMNERTCGKLLGEIGNNEPDLAALLSTKLKRIKES